MCQGEQPMLQQRAGSTNKMGAKNGSLSSHSPTSKDPVALMGKNSAQEMAEELEPIVTQVLSSAPPPWHSVALIGSVAAIMIQMLPSWEEIDQVATLQTFTKAQPWIGSALNLAIVRGVIAMSIWATTLHVLLGPGWTQITNWKPGSKLKRNAKITLKGIKSMFPFTSWSWNLLGISYTLNALIAGCVATGNDQWIGTVPNNALLRTALIAWEIAAPCAILVSTVIRYAIWEMVLHGSGDTTNLKAFRNVMMHNFNSVFVLAEVAMLGQLPVRFSEVSLAPLLGVVYVIFSWNMQHQWADKEHGPQFIYYFFDTTMGKITSISLLALLCSLLLFYVLFATARIGLDYMSMSFASSYEDNFSLFLLAIHVSFTVLISSTVCRFRDHWY